MIARAETLFLTKLIREGSSENVMQLVKSGFNTSVFSPPYKDVLEYIMKYRLRYKQLPTEMEILRDFSSLNKEMLFVDQVPKAALLAIYDEIVKGGIRLDVLKFNEELAAEYAKEEGLELLVYLQHAIRELTARYTRCQGRVLSLADMVPALKEDYDNVISGVADGVPIPFNFIQQDMHGWQEAQITTILAKTGVGKTWFLLMCAIAAAFGNPYCLHLPEECTALSPDRMKQLQSRCLIASCEMPSIDIARRLSALITSISFNRLRGGKLSHEEKELYYRKMDELIYSDKNGATVGIGPNIRIVGPELAGTPEQIMAQADDFDAKMVFIDGFYYMSGSGDKRWEKVEGNMQQMRIHTLISNRHYMLASQFRRDAKSLSSSTTDDAAFSVSIMQDSNNVFGLYQPKALKAAKQMDISGLKQRDGNIGIPYRYRWDLYDMHFEEIGPVTENDGAQVGY